jgi:glutamate synthase (NADPH) large chain
MKAYTYSQFPIPDSPHLDYPLYDPRDEHDACGVGLIAAIDGTARRDVVSKAIEALKSVWHRGAVNGDGKTGDGAGIHLQIPEDFFVSIIPAYERARREGYRIGVGMLFLPRTHGEAQENARLIIETEIVRFGYDIIGWRQVPVKSEVIGDDANKARPEIMQVFIRSKHDDGEIAFESNLYVIRRRIEKSARASAISDCYICSFSSRSIIYKGLFQAAQLAEFYPELNNPLVTSNYAIFHQRFSTNTAPSWHMAQPFRLLAHNGEINTLRGNLNWMSSYEACFGAARFAEYQEDLTPIVPPVGSDTAMLDAVMEYITHSGKSLPFAKLMMIPPAWSRQSHIPQEHRALYEYCNCLMSPWDGPAAIAATDGQWVIAGTDRNGLRPLRYAVTQGGLLTIGSETGMVPVGDDTILELGQLAPGQIMGVHLAEGRLYHDTELKNALAAKEDYAAKVAVIRKLGIENQESGKEKYPNSRFPIPDSSFPDSRFLIAAGITQEDMDLILLPMLRDGKEGVGSMGDDTPLAVLSNQYRGLHHFFRQHFSQVTNPPIDPLREAHTMSLITRVGAMHDILGENPDLSHLFHLDSPILMGAEFAALLEYAGDYAHILDITYPANDDEHALRHAIDAMLEEATKAVDAGKHTLVLCDMNVSADRVAMPVILAAGALHTHMVRQSKRKLLSIIARTSGVWDTHSMAVLIGVGATAVYPYLAEAVALTRDDLKLDDWSLDNHLTTNHPIIHLKTAYEQGLLKIMSKMGISVLSSYRGGRNFDAIGLSRSLVAEFFPGLVSRISGIGLKEIHARGMAVHKAAWSDVFRSPHAGEQQSQGIAVGDAWGVKKSQNIPPTQSDSVLLDSPSRGELSAKVIPLPVGGFYRYRNHGETHAYEGNLIHRLQTACATGSYKQYKDFAHATNAQAPIHIRSLLGMKSDREPIPLHAVESVHTIRKRFVAPAMSLGALSFEAHETLAIAMNRIGAQSNSGEGGEGAERYTPYANGDNANSSIKQVASARFGVTAEYLNACKEIQIKVAQGAKPGEGGQLPAFKVTAEIARLRHATEGVSLISPPPHHDIYSIEDLAQLIYDLKQINPTAIVSVKLVSQSGIGTIASGVVKAMADKIIISGHVGGTGASPYTSIKYAGAPWEMGLAEVTQVLSLNKLRHRVTLQTDGGLKTGRDIVIASLLGAEEYAIGTLSLVAMGCLMVRQCHSNTCPVGICTQDETLRKHFDGTVEKVINLMSFLAEDVREILAELGYATLDEVIGRTDLLHQLVHPTSDTINTLDLTPLLTQPMQKDEAPRIHTLTERNPVADSLDVEMLREAEAAIRSGQKVQLSYSVNNTHRSIGARLSSFLVRNQLLSDEEDRIHLMLRGSAGQSLGAFLVRGVAIEMLGDANDYVGKGLSGGTIIVRPSPSSTLATEANAIIGNTVLYGATSGTLLAAGRAGERFCVRNSGAVAVIEGCGSNGCEYMTGGIAVILGSVGSNFAAGMTGGMAFVYDETDSFMDVVNAESVAVQRLSTTHWEGVLKDLISQHAHATHSLHAANILSQWEFVRGHFWQICPKELIGRLSHPLSDAASSNGNNRMLG